MWRLIQMYIEKQNYSNHISLKESFLKDLNKDMKVNSINCEVLSEQLKRQIDEGKLF